MASGQPVLEIIRESPPQADHATFDVRTGGSTPAENFSVWDFDAAAIETLDFECRLLGNYAGGGLTLTLPWSASSATSGDARWEAAIRRLDTGEDVDTSHSYSYQAVDSTAAGVSGKQVSPTITFTDGAQMDSLAAGERCIVRVRRNAPHANDTMSGDAELWGVSGKET